MLATASSGYKMNRSALVTKPLGDLESPQEEAKDNDILRRALAELRSRKQLPVDMTLASDVTNPRNWYHNTDSVRQIMRKVCELNESACKQESTPTKLISIKGKKKSLRAVMEAEVSVLENGNESHHRPGSPDVIHYTHSEKVRVPTQDCNDTDTQSEMKVVITKTSYGAIQASNDQLRSTKPGGQVEPKVRGRSTQRLPDLPKFVTTKESCSPSIAETPEPIKVKLPILGKSMAQKNEEDVFTRPLKGDIKRIILGLYGESFDPNSSGHYTYKKIGVSKDNRDESPVHQVVPTFDERKQNASSKTLSMFQHKPTADITTRTAATRRRNRQTKSLKQIRSSDENVEEANVFPFPISNWTPREEEKHLLHKQLKLYHQQVAQENIHLLERDFLYRTFPTHPNTAAAFSKRDGSPSNTNNQPIAHEDTAMMTPDADLTFVPVIADLDLKLKKKRDRANDRRRRLDKIKEMKRLRNPHLETVHPKPRSLAQLIDEQRFTHGMGRNDVLPHKVPMETKVYKIFGERKPKRHTIGMKQNQLTDSNALLSPLDVSSDYKVKEVC